MVDMTSHRVLAALALSHARTAADHGGRVTTRWYLDPGRDQLATPPEIAGQKVESTCKTPATVRPVPGHGPTGLESNGMSVPVRVGRAPRGMPEAERFWSKVDKSGDCWLWLGPTSRGYGQFRSTLAGAQVGAHRWAYEQLVGPIPSGLTLDHLCWTTHCVNPAHLEPVTRAENTRRQAARREDRCSAGHQDWYVVPGNTRRMCNECRRVRDRERYRRRTA